MKQTINKFDFRDAFVRADRTNQFSNDALGLIYDYFESAEPNYDLDVDAICCEFSEQSPAAIAADYSIFIHDDEDFDTQIEDYLSENTIVIGKTDNGKFVYIQF